LGSAGALIQNLNALSEHFFVFYGDVMAAVDLPKMARFHLDNDADFTCLVHPNDHPLDSDLLEVDEDGRVTAIHAYPHPPYRDFANLVNAALYVVRREALRPWWSHQGKSLDFTQEVFSGLLANGAKVFAYRSTEYARDMGTPKRLNQVEADWQAGKIKFAQSQHGRRAVFFDRDGTLNVEKGNLRSPQDMELLPGVSDALIALRRAGFSLVVLTNQPVVARGEATEEDLAAIHRRLEWELGKAGAYLDGIYVCLHHPDSGFPGERADLKVKCDCRKPATGLVDRACRELSIDASQSWMIGDQTRDVEMARRAGLRSILVQTGAAGRDGRFQCDADHIAPDLKSAAELVLAGSRGHIT
jgi:D,D-heptose 1,7-bisphosphate phosphatase